jgi:uncharacterized protein YaaQ
MKLILTIVSHDDSTSVIQNLMHKGFSVTKLATTGGFLMKGNTTLLVGCEEEKVQEAIDTITEYSKSRKQIIPTSSPFYTGMYPSQPIEVNVGGATIFVLEVDRFEKV